MASLQNGESYFKQGVSQLNDVNILADTILPDRKQQQFDLILLPGLMKL